VLFANGAILGHVASCLAHKPNGSAVDRLGLAGANEEGIGRGHKPFTVAFVRVDVRAEERRVCETRKTKS
jgi:hypothetical protein